MPVEWITCFRVAQKDDRLTYVCYLIVAIGEAADDRAGFGAKRRGEAPRTNQTRREK
jgi:hypothetical protein